MVAGELSTSSGGTQDDIIVPSHHTSRMMPPTPADHARFRRGSRKKLRHHHNHNRSHTSKTPTSLKHVREQIRYKENQIERAAEHEMKNPSPGKLLVNMEEVREVDFTEPIFDISALRNVPADDGAEESRPPASINKAGKDKGNLETTKKTA